MTETTDRPDQPDAIPAEGVPHLVIKYHQPDVLYDSLEYEGQREILIEEDGLVVERWHFAAGEAEEVADRPHVKRVVHEGYGVVPLPGHVSPLAQTIHIDQLPQLHGAHYLHRMGITAKTRRIAVIDTGISRELSAKLGTKLVAAQSFVKGEDVYDEGQQSGHGTFCLEVLMRLCPDAEFIVAKSLSSKTGWGYTSSILGGIEFAKSNRATGMNLSLGGPGDPDDAMCLACDSADASGILVAAAAGNEQRGNTAMLADGSHPACARRAVAVGCVDGDFLLADFSNWGVCLKATAIGAKILDERGEFWSGTSMSAPVVLGIGELLGSVMNPDGSLRFSHEGRKQALLSGCADSDYQPYQEGLGFANAELAAQRIGLIRDPVDPPVPGAEPYYPELPRVPLSRLRLSMHRPVVGTYKRKDAGRWEPV